MSNIKLTELDSFSTMSVSGKKAGALKIGINLLHRYYLAMDEQGDRHLARMKKAKQQGWSFDAF
ncbi:MAG: hypothetical protein GY861_25810 [bacterium]|nr:hypothetical protein [bacterium]